MILLCGIPSEPPLHMVAEALQRLRLHYFLLNQRHVAQTAIRFELRDDKVTGWLESGSESYRLEDFDGVYLRLMDERFLPELRGERADSALRMHSQNLHQSLLEWLEVTDARVVNRPSAMMSNNSKPYQAQLIRQQGLCIPDTLITNEPELVCQFQRLHGRIVYKSISGVRSIVQVLEDKDLARLDKIRWCPTQFQEFIDGENVRVHVVGEQTFATVVRSDAIDYRYAHTQEGRAANLEAFNLDADTSMKCVALAKALNLPFAGVDLKISSSGRIYCFEVNPCPGFSYYEANAGQPISTAVAEYLSCGSSVTKSATASAHGSG